MNINVTQRLSRNKQKIYYNLEWGKSAGQRMSTGIFTYVKPKDQIQKNHKTHKAQKTQETSNCSKSLRKPKKPTKILKNNKRHKKPKNSQYAS